MEGLPGTPAEWIEASLVEPVGAVWRLAGTSDLAKLDREFQRLVVAVDERAVVSLLNDDGLPVDLVARLIWCAGMSGREALYDAVLPMLQDRREYRSLEYGEVVLREVREPAVTALTRLNKGLAILDVWRLAAIDTPGMRRRVQAMHWVRPVKAGTATATFVLPANRSLSLDLAREAEARLRKATGEGRVEVVRYDVHAVVGEFAGEWNDIIFNIGVGVTSAAIWEFARWLLRELRSRSERARALEINLQLAVLAARAGIDSAGQVELWGAHDLGAQDRDPAPAREACRFLIEHRSGDTRFLTVVASDGQITDHQSVVTKNSDVAGGSA